MNHNTSLEFISTTKKGQLSAYISRLYLEAFPPEERREEAEWWRLAEDKKNFTIDALLSGGKPVGLLTYWDFPAFRYVEHFAIDAACRGGGLGGSSLNAFISSSSLPVVLEIEPPETEQAIRRADFYSRHGFLTSTRSYLQPPYGPDFEPLPLLLLCNDKDFLEKHFDEVVRTIHTNVYFTQD